VPRPKANRYAPEIHCILARENEISAAPTPYLNERISMEAGKTASEGRELKRIHLGCGLITPPGWVNMDGSWNARLAKHPVLRRALHAFHLIPADKLSVPWNPEIIIHDVRKPLPFPDGCASAIYASHIFEHLYLEEGQRLLRECYRVLAAGGVLRLVVPDLNSMAREYLGERPHGELPKEAQSEPAGDRLNRRLLLRSTAPPSGGVFYRIYSSWKDFHSHKWMYDANSLAFHIAAAGFTDVREKALHESLIPGVEAVEEPSRILGGEGISVEGVKPGSGNFDR
jgi:SAM-dependent methyltransferase